MTSGVFTSFPVEQIWVDRDDRQRKEIDKAKVASLASSIKTIGLINPLLVHRDGKIRAGETRWEAVRSLGWTHVSVQFVEDLRDDELALIELAENVERTDLPWQDQCLALEKYHNLRAKLDPNWTQAKTAEALNISQKEVGSKRNVAKELEGGNKRVLEAPRYTIARGIVERERERQKTSVLEQIEMVETGKDAPEQKPVPLLNTDFTEWVKDYNGPAFNFIHCDFPYGIKADDHAQGAAASFGGYADGFDVYVKLIDTLEQGMETMIAPSAHLMFWFSMKFYQYTVDRLTQMGWVVNPVPLIWAKSDNIGILPDPKRGPRQIYECCLIASRGDRQIVRAVSNVYWGPTTKDIHMSEKPVYMLKKFMEMFVDKFTIALDPTAGSGNAVKAALALGAPSVLGLELNKDFYDLSVDAFYSNEL